MSGVHDLWLFVARGWRARTGPARALQAALGALLVLLAAGLAVLERT